MKRKLLSIATLAFIIQANAQIYNSGFENNNGTPISSYTKINADGNVVANYAPVQDFNTDAWIQYYDGFDNKIAFSTSSYDPAGTSNDWLITPSISIPAVGNPTLYWKAKSYDFDFADSYSIKVSETDTQISSFSKTLLDVTNEQAYDFNSRSLDLSAYKGKTIHLAIVNNTTDGYFLAFDDLYISNSANCVMPDLSGFTASNLTGKSFTVNWSATPGINSFDTGLTPFLTPVLSTGIQTATTKNYDNLQPGIRYQFFLKNAGCGSGWAGPKSVFTAANLPYSYNFEYTDENYGEYDSDGWTSGTWINGSGSAQSGDGYVFNNTSKTFPKNDYIFSYPIKMAANEKVEIKYFAQMGSAVASPATLKVSVATAPNRESITQELSSNSISGNTYIEYSSTFTATTEGVYYFGFGNVTAPVANNAALRIDNIRFEKINLAVSEDSKIKMKVFPNPVKDILKIQSEEKILKLEIYSMDGKLIKILFNTDQVDFSKDDKGIYLLKIQTKSGIQTQKVIK